MDNLSAENRAKTMRAVKSKGSKIESAVSKSLWSAGFRFRKNVETLPGCPDIAIKKYKFVLFVDSCFWHGCKEHCSIPKSNVEYWNRKIRRNVERDNEITSYYVHEEWTILRIWEHDLRSAFEEIISSIILVLDNLKSHYSRR